MTRVRRRSSRNMTAAREWEQERDFETARDIAAGLGMRSERWWTYESDRPDLAESAELDAYAHLRGGMYLDRAVERLRYLVHTARLADTERLAIITGEGPRFAWRVRILTEAGRPQP